VAEEVGGRPDELGHLSRKNGYEECPRKRSSAVSPTLFRKLDGTIKIELVITVKKNSHLVNIKFNMTKIVYSLLDLVAHLTYA